MSTFGDSIDLSSTNIHPGGETIKDMQNQTGCKINVSPASGRDVEREIGLIGTRHAIEAAKRAILSKVDAVVGRYFLKAGPFADQVIGCS